MLFIYNETSQAFLKSVKQMAREIVVKELGLEMRRERFVFNKYLYPVHFVLFERHQELGFFDPKNFQIGLHKKLMYEAKTEVIKNIIRHELCHYLSALFYPGADINPHGKEFREVATRFGYGPEVYGARTSIDLSNQAIEGDLETERVIEKVKKLLSLATSSNEHEAALATARANELLLRHHLDKIKTRGLSDSEDETVMMRVIEAKRLSAKERAIADILETSLVKTVFNQGGAGVYLEVIGERANVEMANYLASFLSHELDFLYKSAKKNNPELKGLRARNSFFRGVSKGFLSKINEHKKASTDTSSLVVVTRDLERRMSIVYPRLSYKGVREQSSSFALGLGLNAGRDLNLRKGLSSTNTGKTLSLGMS